MLCTPLPLCMGILRGLFDFFPSQSHSPPMPTGTAALHSYPQTPALSSMSSPGRWQCAFSKVSKGRGLGRLHSSLDFSGAFDQLLLFSPTPPMKPLLLLPTTQLLAVSDLRTAGRGIVWELDTPYQEAGGWKGRCRGRKDTLLRSEPRPAGTATQEGWRASRGGAILPAPPPVRDPPSRCAWTRHRTHHPLHVQNTLHNSGSGFCGA